MSSRPPRIALVGRTNVGKSTLANRLAGRRQAIAHESAGVTRDRVEVETSWRGRRFILIDTGGFTRGGGGIGDLVAAQADRASATADLVALVVDVRTGPLEEDTELARRLRRAPQPVVVVANKVDADREEGEVGAFERLGLGAAVPVSALHGRGAGDLLDRLVALLPPEHPAEAEPGDVPRFAIVGRANVGKSSLFNRLVGEERSVVFEEAGTTRDAVDALVGWPTGDVRFVDTAGLRRSSRTQGIEYYSFLRTTEAIVRSDVAALVIDAAEGLTTEDKRIAARVMGAGRALLIVANKWDLVEEKQERLRELRERTSVFANARSVRTSALRGTGVHRLGPALLDVRARWTGRAPTAAVNESVHAAQRDRPTPRGQGTFHYATQVSSAPPSFVLFGARAPDASYRRYLENRLRRDFELDGVPMRLTFRTRRRKAPASRRDSAAG
jgi:GTPase